MSKSTQINTLEELVALASSPGRQDDRYSLEIVRSTRWVDEEAGKTFHVQHMAMEEAAKEIRLKNGGSYDDPEYRAAREAEDKWYWENRPVEEQFHRYYLDHRTGEWNRSTIDLSLELGTLIESVWTKKADRYGSGQRMTGVLTLLGIVKRLGVDTSGVAAQIKDAKRKAEEEKKRNSRNWARRQINQRMNELTAFVQNNGAKIGVTTEMFNLPVELAELLVEEKEA